MLRYKRLEYLYYSDGTEYTQKFKTFIDDRKATNIDDFLSTVFIVQVSTLPTQTTDDLDGVDGPLNASIIYLPKVDKNGTNIHGVIGDTSVHYSPGGSVDADKKIEYNIQIVGPNKVIHHRSPGNSRSVLTVAYRNWNTKAISPTNPEVEDFISNTHTPLFHGGFTQIQNGDGVITTNITLFDVTVDIRIFQINDQKVHHLALNDLAGVNYTDPPTDGHVLTYSSATDEWVSAPGGGAAAANKVTKGGDTDGAVLEIGTNDAQFLQLKTNNTTRLSISSLSGQLSVPVSYAPTGNESLTDKKYVDSQVDTKVSKSGDTMTGPLDMGLNTISTGTAPTLGAHLTYKAYVDNQDLTKVTKTGDTMTGTLNMGANKVTTTYVPVNGEDLTNKTYVDGVSGNKVTIGGDNGLLTVGTNDANDLILETNNIGRFRVDTAGILKTLSGTYSVDISTTDAMTNKQYVDTADALKVNKAGDTMTGNLTMGANKVTSTSAPTTNDDLTRKGYVDGVDATKITKGGDTEGAPITIGTNDGFNLAFETNNVPRMVIDGTSHKITVDGTYTVTATNDITDKKYVDAAYTTSNTGTGSQLAKAKVGTDFPFRSIRAPVGDIISTTQNTNDVTIATDPLAFGSAVGYYDVVQLTAAFPSTFSAGHASYPPIGGHQPGRIYINTTEKVIFVSNHQRPLADLTALPTASGEGTNALASIIAQIAGNGGAIPLVNTYEAGPPVFKFYGSKPTQNYETPAREICFRVNWNNGVVAAVGMPSQTQNTNSSAEYGGFAAGNDSNWTWFRYGLSNFEIDLYDGDILTTYTRWWFRPGYIDSWHDLKFLDDNRDIQFTTPTNRQIIVYNNAVGKWVNHTPPYLYGYFDNNATVSGTGTQNNYHWVQGTITTTATSHFSLNANNALTYTGTAISPKLFEVSYSATPVVGSNDRTIYIVAAKNKNITPVQVVVPPATITDYIPGSRATVISRTAIDDTSNTSGRFTVSLATNDFVRFFVANVENNDTVTISDFRFTIKEVGY